MLKRVLSDGSDIPLKKLFYALRPAAALRWLRMHPQETVVPMHFPTLVQHCDLSEALREEIDVLLRAKSKTRELGRGPMPCSIGAFLQSEYELAERSVPMRPRAATGPVNREAEEFFRDMLRRYGESP